MLYVSWAPAGAGSVPGPVQRLLADPAVAQLLGMGEGEGTAAFGLIERLLKRASGSVELALLGIVPGAGDGRLIAGRPLLALRAELDAGDAERLQTLLADARLARPHRSVGGVPTFVLGGDERAGELVEAVVVGCDLVVANHGEAIDEVLGGGEAPRALAGNERFLALRRELGGAGAQLPGSLLVYGDWRRLGRRLQTAAGGLGRFLVDWSGLGGAEAVMASIQGRGDDLVSTVLLEFGEKQPVDGWLSLVQQAPARSLLADLPPGGIGGIALAVDPDGLSTPRSGRFGGLLSNGCNARGLDLQHQVLDRLGRRSALQLQLQRPQGGGLAAAGAVAARSRKHARELFDDLAGAVRKGGGDVLSARDHGVDQVDLGRLFDGAARVGVIDDSVVFGFHAGSLAELEAARHAKAPPRRDAQVAAALQALAVADKVAGVFALDLSPWLAELPAAASGSLPPLHAGCIELGEGTAGALLRLRMLSSH